MSTTNKPVQTIKSRRAFLLVQGLLCFALGFFMFYITVLNPQVSAVALEVPKALFVILCVLVIALFLAWSFFYCYKAFFYSIEQTETALVFHMLFRTTVVPLEDIFEIVWSKHTARFAGIIPLFRADIGTLVDQHHRPLVTVSSLEYKNIKPFLEKFEVTCS